MNFHMLPTVKYELHDSTIVSILSEPVRTLCFVIDLYPIFYRAEPRIELRFEGVQNFEAVQKYAETIREAADDDYLGCRIDAFHYDTKRESKAGSCRFCLWTDWCGPLRIHCSSMSMIEMQK